MTSEKLTITGFSFIIKKYRTYYINYNSELVARMGFVWVKWQSRQGLRDMGATTAQLQPRWKQGTDFH